MPAIPMIIFDAGFSEMRKGTLINPPSELFSKSQMAVYAASKAGWGRCPLGYGMYTAFDSLGRKIVVPGIYLLNEPAPNRRFPNYPIKFTRAQIEDFASSHLVVSQEVKDKRDLELKNLTHDLRAISNEIYHNALGVRASSEQFYDVGLLQQIDTVLAAQQMMSVRLDIIDYESGLASQRPKEAVSPFRKTEKVVKCFDSKIRANGLTRKIEGNSFSNTFGPPIFEIVPFVIVENAIKYAPRGTQIVIRFTEENEQVIIRFDSIGPRVSDAEKLRIFERAYRGDAVRDSDRGGSGIGLFAAQTIVENQFGGKVFVNQLGESMWINGETYWDTRFTVVLPIIKEETYFMPKKRRNS